MGIKDSRFINACFGRNEDSIPIWILRQAGRYLPEYREIRAKVSFNELCRSPELICKVVKQPIDRFGLDAAILFSDILTMLEPMGMEVTFPNGGPQMAKPISTPEDIKRLKPLDAEKDLPFVYNGIRRIKEELPGTPLIGFVGSPFTLACYLIEGKGSKNFDKPKRFIHENPKAAEELFEILSDGIVNHLQAQIDAGVDAVQIFESWGGILANDDFLDWSARFVNHIFSSLKGNVPRILFVNNIAPYLDIVKDVDCEVVGVDYRANLAAVASALPAKAIQGNLDPSLLFASTDKVVKQANIILDSLNDHNRLIFNLGHGIQPETPIASVEALVQTIHNYR